MISQSAILISFETIMAQLVVRNLPDEVKERLKRRARAHNRSVEAEVRAILVALPELPNDALQQDNFVDRLMRALAQHKVSDETWEEFDRNLKSLRTGVPLRAVDFSE